ncbi:MAG: AAA family ATPase [Methanosarcinaceae archaeon]|nr:AAA family ATPase [Methanosarcinaceae archaeon]
MVKNRYLTKFIFEDLLEKMVFIGGARQVGKTTLSTHLVARYFESYEYFNWDNRYDRKKIIDSDWSGSAKLLILDEIHKYKKWKTLINGHYDKLKSRYKFLVTGSSRPDVYRKGSDSLQGRYHYYRLHPFSLAEILNRENKIEPFEEIAIDSGDNSSSLVSLNRFGGFPEPFIKQNTRFLRRWHNEKTERLFREDIRDTEQIRDLGNMKLLSDMLVDKVGSLLSINSIREDLEVSHRAASNWLDILELFYYHFRIYPYAVKTIRSIKKEPKLYLWDWSEIENPAVRFENLIASHLLKLVHFLTDHDGYKTQLCFLRNVDKKEVDFLVTVDKKPWFAVEAKRSEEEVSRSLAYFRERLNIPFVYQILEKPNVDRHKSGIRVVSADKFLAGLV